jgi:hypothetical protein
MMVQALREKSGEPGRTRTCNPLIKSCNRTENQRLTGNATNRWELLQVAIPQGFRPESIALRRNWQGLPVGTKLGTQVVLLSEGHLDDTRDAGGPARRS